MSVDQSRVPGLLAWLTQQGLLATPVDKLVHDFFDRVNAIGLPVLRIHISTTMLHPQYSGFAITIWRGENAERDSFLHGSQSGPEFQNSPVRAFMAEIESRAAEWTHGQEVSEEPLFATHRYRLDRGEGLDRFELLRRFSERGGTDYLLTGMPFGFDGMLPENTLDGVLVSWVTDRPGGFSQADLEFMRVVTGPLALALRASVLLEMGATVLRTYLGGDAGLRVLYGDIRRGEVETIDAAILFADLRGFTALADVTPQKALVAMLDDYLEAMADPVEAHGGQVLKYLGDGLLATFPCDGNNHATVCAEAVATAQEIQAATERLNRQRQAEGQPTMGVDVALHRGEVLYGNVGSTSRMDFTVIGPAVNEAARIETMCKALDQSILLSEDFVEAAHDPGAFRSVGQHSLPGIAAPSELFVPADRTVDGDQAR